MNKLELSNLLGKSTAAVRTTPGPHSIVIEAAYLEFVRRRAAGDELDVDEYCAQFPEVSDSLAVLCECHELFPEDPAFSEAVPGPTDWPEVGATWEGFELL